MQTFTLEFLVLSYIRKWKNA